MVNARRSPRTASRDVHAPIEARLRLLRERLTHLRLDAHLLTHAADIAHLTGFSGHDSAALVTGKSVTVITDSRYQEELASAAPHVKAVIRKRAMTEALAGVLAKGGLTKVGFETNFVTFGLIDGIRRELRKAKKPVTLMPLADLMVTLRRIKDATEVDSIRRAIGVAEASFLKVIRKVRPGVSEGAIAGQLIQEMRSRGASDVAFQPIIAAGAHSSLPHYTPDQTPVTNDSALLFDWGALVDGYRSDLTRTVFVGKPHPKLEEVYRVVLDANLATIGALRAGLNCKAADAVARKIIKRAGYGGQFGHGVGHGIGRDIHEEPRLHFLKDKDQLEPGNIVTVEPGIYLPGIGGVRIEDDVLVTDTGCQVLTSLEKSFDWATQVIGG